MALPLAGIRVLEFTHTIMGPCAGLVMADLGADVVKIEPAPEGDRTRTLPGFAAGFFGFFNRNKRAAAIDLKRPEGQALARRLALQADVVIENFGPGTMERLGCGWEALSAENPRLVYLALKGFLSGPYEHRPALDEVVQFMSGLAYMTGPPGQPLRAGASIVDILGGVYGVVAVLAALKERDRTGKGQLAKSALYESAVFLMGQHMAGQALTGEMVPPMTARRGAWSVYQPFDTADGEQVFLGLTSEAHWRRFCAAFERPDLLHDPRLATNSDRVAARLWLLPLVQEILKPHAKAELLATFEREGLPFAPVARTEDLFDDPHLATGGKLLETVLGPGIAAKVPALPIEMDGATPGLRLQPPGLGEHTAAVLTEAGLGAQEIAALAARGTILVSG